MSEDLRDLARRLNLPEDDPLLLVARGNAQLENKVELWSATIVQVLDLVRIQNEQAVRSAEQSERLSDSLRQFGTELDNFKTQFKQQNQILSKLTPASTELNQIRQNLKVIETAQTHQTEQSNEIQKAVQATGNVNRRWVPWILGGLLGVFLCQIAQTALLQMQLNALRERSEWALTKLERLEKRK